MPVRKHKYIVSLKTRLLSPKAAARCAFNKQKGECYMCQGLFSVWSNPHLVCFWHLCVGLNQIKLCLSVCLYVYVSDNTTKYHPV